MVAGGVCGRGACVAEEGVHGRGVCMAGVGACMAGGVCGRGRVHGRGACAWQGVCMACTPPPDTTSGTHPTGMHSCLKIRPEFRYLRSLMVLKPFFFGALSNSP